MTTEMIDTKRSRSATELDRETEKFSIKLLEGKVSSEDEAEFERLLSARKRRLVKLRSVRKLGQNRWFRSAS